MTTPHQRALANLTADEAAAIFQALDQYVENTGEEVELILDSESEGQSTISRSEQATIQHHAAAEVVLERVNTELAGLV